jgi:DNA polymerase-3 subunit delta
MPIHLLWGDDEAARSQAAETLIQEKTDPAWVSINLSRLDGSDTNQAAQALSEARTAPFGSGDRVVVLQRSPFCNQCSSELAEQLEVSLPLIPESCHLLLINPAKPDGRLRTTKRLQQLVKAGQVSECSFCLPALWDSNGQLELVQRTAANLGVTLERAAAEALCQAVGSDSGLLVSELNKLTLYAGLGQPITLSAVQTLVSSQATNALQVGEALLAGQPAEAVALVDVLLASNEPALRIVATLCGQVRGWLWVSLLDQRGEQDVNAIAKAAGIGNPKRIYVLRKQLRGRRPAHLLALLKQVLAVELALKRGSEPGNAFREGFILNSGMTGP